jgi:hypothetical protein
MKLLLSNIQWLRVVVSSLLIVMLSFLVVTLITAGYAFILAFEAHGKPDQATINHFASSISWWMIPLFEIFFTFIISLISTKKARNKISIHGLLIGILAGFLSIMMKIGFGGQLNYRTYIFFIIIVGLGFVGGFFSKTQLAKKIKSPV